MATYTVILKEDWHTVATKLLAEAVSLRTWCLHGNLGAGKTTLIKAICHQLGIKQPITSPTFNIMHQYDSPQHTVHHVDLYRINNMHRIFDIGLQDLLYAPNYLFIEWPNIIQPLLKYPYFDIHITEKDQSHRIIEAKVKTNK